MRYWNKGKHRSTRWAARHPSERLYNLQNHSLVPDSPCYPLPIQIFEQRDCKFPADASQVFEFTNTDFRVFGFERFDLAMAGWRGFIAAAPMLRYLWENGFFAGNRETFHVGRLSVRREIPDLKVLDN